VIQTKAPREYASYPAIRARLLESHTGKLTEADADHLLSRGCERTDGGAWRFRHDLKHLIAVPLRPTEAQVRRMLGAIAWCGFCSAFSYFSPCLIVRALGGTPFPKTMIKGRVDAIARCTYKEIEGNHHIHLVLGNHPMARRGGGALHALLLSRYGLTTFQTNAGAVHAVVAPFLQTQRSSQSKL
jgi:hypothetical protein